MTLAQRKRNNRREIILRLKMQGKSVWAIAQILRVSRGQVQRALMTEDQRINYYAQAALRKERATAKNPWGNDRLLKKLYEVFGQPRCDTAPELIGTQFA